jgi:hypothetical protein
VWQGPAIDVTPGDAFTLEASARFAQAGSTVTLELLGSSDPSVTPDYFQPGVSAVLLRVPFTADAGETGNTFAQFVVPSGVARLRLGVRVTAGPGIPAAPTTIDLGPVLSARVNDAGETVSTGLVVELDGIPVTSLAWAPLEVTWGREHPGDSLDPRRAVLAFDGLAGAARGQILTVQVNAPASDPTWADVTDTWATIPGTWLTTRRQLRVFAGFITDRSTSWRPIQEHVRWDVLTDVIALDPIAELRTVGDAPWPEESAQERASRITSLTVLPWTIDPAPQIVAARDVDAQPAAALLDDLASWVSVSGGVYFDPVTLRAYWLTDESRNSRDADLVLTSSQITDGARLVETVTDVVNDFTVIYRDSQQASDRPEHTASNPSSVERDGRRHGSRDTGLVDEADAVALAQELVTRYGHSGPRFVDVEVIPSRITRSDLETLLGLGPRARLRFTELPDPSTPSWSGYLEGCRLEIPDPDPDTWRITLTLSPVAWSGPLLAWSDVTPARPWSKALDSWSAATDSLDFTP